MLELRFEEEFRNYPYRSRVSPQQLDYELGHSEAQDSSYHTNPVQLCLHLDDDNQFTN